MRYKQLKYAEKIKDIIYERGGTLLSEISDSKTKIKIKCENEHIFFSTPTKIQQKRWCQLCRRVPFEKVQEYVKNKHGRVCGKYDTMQSKLRFTCSEGHTWVATPANVMLQGTWCPNCANRTKLDIFEFDKIARSKGGFCLTKSYNTQQDKLRFQCAKNHEWEAYAKHIRAGHWCPICHVNFCEEISRYIFQNLFNANFPKTKPDWLINNYGYQLELDGYCQEFGIAFEHQGLHHYGKDIYSCGSNKIKRIKQNDKIKKYLCAIHGVKLIEIPQLFDILKMDQLLPYLYGIFNSTNIQNFKEILHMPLTRREWSELLNKQYK
jgi:hypothetical protein